MVAGDAGLDGAPVAHLHRAHVLERKVEGHAPHVVDRPDAGEEERTLFNFTVPVLMLIRVP